MNNRVLLVAAVLVTLATTVYPIASAITARLTASLGKPPFSAMRIANDLYQVPASSNVLVFGQVTNMTATILASGNMEVQFFSDCAVSVSGSGVLLWVRLTIDGIPSGAPANPAYPGVHEFCGLTAGGYVVSEGYRSTLWAVSGLPIGTHTFALQATLAGFTSGVLTGPGPGANGVLGLRTMLVQG